MAVSSENDGQATSSVASPRSVADDGTRLHVIRLVPAVDSFTYTPLQFDPIERKAKEGQVLRIGRFSDKPGDREVNDIAFKSKVVSRAHAEVWCDRDQWFIKDIKSSSGTFLNHIRLSPPSSESAPCAVKNGDVVQLGIDFRGGHEEIFRCVKMRCEINGGLPMEMSTFK